VKSAYDMQFEGSTESPLLPMVWKVWAPSRYKFFMWLMLQSRIWTVDRLLMWEWPDQYFCPLSKLRDDGSPLFIVPMVRQIWLIIINWCGLPGFHPQRWKSDEAIVDWLNGLSSPHSSTKAKGALTSNYSVLGCVA
jgi:hypothetical protein